MEPQRGSGWVTAAQTTLGLAVFVTALECSTFLWRVGVALPDSGLASNLYSLYGVVYLCGIFIGVPATVLTAIVVGFKRGRPRRLGLISGVMILAGFGVAILALMTEPA